MTTKVKRGESLLDARLRLNWRGPFKVVRKHHTGLSWRIINRYGEVERIVYRAQETADTACRRMNEVVS